jgi:RNA polymerase sigma-70 factor (ECF subfamily)
MPLPDAPPSEDSRWQAWLRDQGKVFLLYARQQTRSEADAQDVFQEALFEAWRKSDGRVPDKPLVLATIRRRAIDLARSNDRRCAREQREAADIGPWFAQDFSGSDTRDFVHTAISHLPEALREVLVLRIWGDLSFPEIAELTGAPVATATSRYRYALERLRGTLTEFQP